MLAYLIVQFYGYPFSSLDYRGSRVLNALVVIVCRLILPVLFAWIIYNYYGFGLEALLEEIGLNSLICDDWFSSRRFGQATKRWKDRRYTGELEMVASLNGLGGPEEANGLMLDKQNGDSQLNEKLLNEQNNRLDAKLNEKINERPINKSMDKLILEMQDRLAHDGLLKIKLDELIVNESRYSVSNHFKLIEFDSINRMAKNGDLHPKAISNHREKFSLPQSLASLLSIYSRLARSLYLSHHFYLTYDLYTVRSPLATDLYHITTRLTYNLFFSHLLALLFHLLIERPLNSSIKLIGRRISQSFQR